MTRAALAAALLAALAVAGIPATRAGVVRSTAGDRIVLGSFCYGETHPYSILADGSGVTPLLPPDRQLTPLAISGDDNTVAYRTGGRHSSTTWLDTAAGSIYVSRADGTGLRRVAADGNRPALSRDGKRLAFTKDGVLWVVGTDGLGLRRLASGSPYIYSADWSPDGKALVVLTGNGAVVVQPLHGKRRVLASSGGSIAKWSPDRRWIAYSAESAGLILVRPDGSGRHRVRIFPEWLSWSHDGGRLAVLDNYQHVYVVDADGRGLRRLAIGLDPSDLAFSPDGQQLALVDLVGKPPQLLVVDSDGRGGRRRLTSACSNTLVGWTRLAPRLPSAAPSESVLAADTVATRNPVEALAADGAHVAFAVRSSPTDCEHLDLWAPGDPSLRRVEAHETPCRAGNESEGITELALADGRVGWAGWYPGGSTDCTEATSGLWSAGLGDQQAVFLANAYTNSCQPTGFFHLHGKGDLLVFDHRTRLVSVGGGVEKCSDPTTTSVREMPDTAGRICTTLRRGADAGPVDSVGGGRIAIRNQGAVTVLDEQGKLVRVFPFAPADVSAARLDADRLVVWRFGRLEAWSVANGTRELTRPLPAGYRLEDVDGGIAVLLGSDTIVLLRLDDGRSFTLEPGRGPLLADLEPQGLYYTHTGDDGGGRVVFFTRAELVRRLDQGKG